MTGTDMIAVTGILLGFALGPAIWVLTIILLANRLVVGRDSS